MWKGLQTELREHGSKLRVLTAGPFKKKIIVVGFHLVYLWFGSFFVFQFQKASNSEFNELIMEKVGQRQAGEFC